MLGHRGLDGYTLYTGLFALEESRIRVWEEHIHIVAALKLDEWGVGLGAGVVVVGSWAGFRGRV